MNKRYLGAILLSPFIIFLFIGGLYLKYGIMVLSLLGLYEFFKVCREKEINGFNTISYILCILYYITLNNNINYKYVMSILILAVIMLLCIPVINIKYNFIDVAITILAILYIPIFFSFIVLVENKFNGNYLVWLIFISSWLCDTCAYYAGMFFGKTKLCPKVSPKKTIEGSIGGLLGSTLICTIYGAFLVKIGVAIPLIHFAIIGLLCGILCQFGDLVASSIKRYVGVKDYSNLIPGHGGILDRFDSILFASLVVYYYITFILGI